ncbi:helix-turn-helix domain-containing protein [Xylanimonas ulmi]|uniref:Helix-turn-helix protein n=1 Tax=Xylanimonas ulmi TaxID=228973 RepID=A0A4Q7M0L1_9MICO|nr:helix-turn-helix transcriptional regulator [Xylanibacterium ulmi]RZS60277.1 helix-turn-helix protein [Xylanibacterium ulmi]
MTTDAQDPLLRHALGQELRRLRHRSGRTLHEVARRAGVSPQYLSEMERGVKEPSSEMIAAVCGALEVRLVDLTLGVAAALGAARHEAAQQEVARGPVALSARRPAGPTALALAA